MYFRSLSALVVFEKRVESLMIQKIASFEFSDRVRVLLERCSTFYARDLMLFFALERSIYDNIRMLLERSGDVKMQRVLFMYVLDTETLL